MNRNLMLAIVVIALAAVGFWLYGKSKRDAALPDLAPVGATLIEGLGDYSMPVTAKNADVQRWFDQGLAMTYGFNHDAAERSFLKAAELDPDCAMCWWGSALVLGPHVNAQTGFDETIYMVQLPTDQGDIVARGMQALADFAAREGISLPGQAAAPAARTMGGAKPESESQGG